MGTTISLGALEKNLCPLTGIERRLLRCSARTVVTIPIMLMGLQLQ
jgi:hypothetical protein